VGVRAEGEGNGVNMIEICMYENKSEALKLFKKGSIGK
jgi:hypothetical protein